MSGAHRYSGAGKVLLFRLYEKQSAQGRRYFAGRLGAASVVALLDEFAEADDPVWEVFVQDGPPTQPHPQTRQAPPRRDQQGRQPEPSPPADYGRRPLERSSVDPQTREPETVRPAAERAPVAAGASVEPRALPSRPKPPQPHQRASNGAARRQPPSRARRKLNPLDPDDPLPWGAP